MKKLKSSPPAPPTSKEIKAFLLARFKSLPEANLQVMRELQVGVAAATPTLKGILYLGKFELP